MDKRRNQFRLIYIIIYIFSLVLLGSLFMIIFAAIIAGIRGLNVGNIVNLTIGINSKYTPTEAELSASFAAKGYGNTAAYLVMFVCAIFFLKDDFKEDFISLKENKKFYIYYILIASVLFTGIAFLISYLIGLAVKDSQNQETIVKIMKTTAMVPMIISTAIFAPVVEEMIYRKCVFYYTRNNKIYFRYAASILLFSLPHVITSIGNFSVGDYFLMCIPYVLDAFMLALIYHKGKYNVYTSIACHIANNILAIILLFV